MSTQQTITAGELVNERRWLIKGSIQEGTFSIVNPNDPDHYFIIARGQGWENTPCSISLKSEYYDYEKDRLDSLYEAVSDALPWGGKMTVQDVTDFLNNLWIGGYKVERRRDLD